MWINRKQYEDTLGVCNKELAALREVNARAAGQNECLKVEIAQLRSEMNWFKHRLNQVERERGQLIQAAIGVKIAVPEFVPTYEDPAAALHEMPNLSSVGGDALEQDEAPDETNDSGIDFSLMPGYKRGK